MTLAAIPSPTQSVWHLGFLPIRAYALCIVLGIVAACVVSERRMRQRGAPPNLVLDIVIYAVPAGIIGARIYHVITSPGDYFGADGNFADAFRIWKGGIGIWGAVLGGAGGAAFACRRLGIPLRFFADALAPGLPLAQGIGRWGNYFNNELYGGPTHLPWGLKVYDFDLTTGKALTDEVTGAAMRLPGLYHPTFLYESLWDIGVAIAVWLIDRKVKFGRGRAFALYVAMYCVGRFWIEAMRTDPAQMILGMRLNNWTALVVFIGAVIYFVRVRGPQERMIVAQDGTITLVPIGDIPAGAVLVETPALEAPALETAALATASQETASQETPEPEESEIPEDPAAPVVDPAEPAEPAESEDHEDPEGQAESTQDEPTVKLDDSSAAVTSGEAGQADNVEAPDEQATAKPTTDA